ncbi:MAG: DUF3048 domain-containing protein [Defluviitaleaceae bacterium]|nr:DUF3048 domain-containing protein [Defluviitaleaceae bacterium]
MKTHPRAAAFGRFRVGTVVIIIIIALAASACSSESQPPTTPVMATPAPTPHSAPEPEPTPEPAPTTPPDMGVNSLTGEYIHANVTGRRPVAIVFDNIRRALPQSGLAQADILYEVLAEGGVTRLVGIFKDFDSERVGPVRSTRNYFIDFAVDHDAIFVHHGGSPQAYNDLRSMNIDRLDGMFEAQVFWRERGRPLEHSSFTGAGLIWGRVNDLGLRQQLDSRQDSVFDFYPILSSPRESEPAAEFEIRFAQGYTTSFLFDESTGLYSMSATHGPQIDEETGEQLTFSNIIVQNTRISMIPGDTAGRRNVDTVGQGTGYVFTNGSVAPIRWAKSSRSSPTRWYNDQGLRLNLNRGRTYIAVADTSPTILATGQEPEDDPHTGQD